MLHVEDVADVDVTLRDPIDNDADRTFGRTGEGLCTDAADLAAATGASKCLNDLQRGGRLRQL